MMTIHNCILFILITITYSKKTNYPIQQALTELERFSLELSQNGILNGYDPQFDGNFIYQRDVAAKPSLASENVQPNPNIYERHLIVESRSQQVLLHSLFWILSPIFKQEAQEVYHFFTVSSPTNYCDANGILKGMNNAKWPNLFRSPMDVQKHLLSKYTEGGKNYLNFQEFIRMALDFTKNFALEGESQFFFQKTKQKINEQIDFMLCNRDIVTHLDFCSASAKQLGCNLSMADSCNTQIRNIYYSVTKYDLCQASLDLFQRYSQKYKNGLPRDELVDLIINSMYEMIYMSFFNKPTINDYYSGYILPNPGPLEMPSTINLLKTQPTQTQVVYKQELPILEYNHNPIYYTSPSFIDKKRKLRMMKSQNQKQIIRTHPTQIQVVQKPYLPILEYDRQPIYYRSPPLRQNKLRNKLQNIRYKIQKIQEKMNLS